MLSAQGLVTGEEVNRRFSAFSLLLPVLIADKNPAVVDAVASVVRTCMPGAAPYPCSSHSYAIHSLTTARYQIVLCGAQFAEAGGFMFLRQHRAFQPAVPFLLVAEGDDRDLVKCVFEQEGVEDIVVWPLVEGQLEESVRQAMCLYRTRLTMADRTQRLHTLHSCESLPSKQTRRAIRRIEANLKDLTRVVEDCEREAHQRAVEHLDSLGRGHRGH